MRRSPPKKRQTTPPSVDKRVTRSPMNKRKRVSFTFSHGINCVKPPLKQHIILIQSMKIYFDFHVPYALSTCPLLIVSFVALTLLSFHYRHHHPRHHHESRFRFQLLRIIHFGRKSGQVRLAQVKNKTVYQQFRMFINFI